MPAHLDDPAPGLPFNPTRFRVYGWLLLEGLAQAELAAVEVWSGDSQLGETTTFHVRPDVNAKYALPPGTQAGFTFCAHHPGAAPGEPIQLELRARLRDGTRTPPVFATRVAPLPLERNPLAALISALPPTARGLEIGAHALPVPGLTPFYTDTVAEYAGTAGRVDFLADALALPLPNAALDYLCSSHVLEHLPDPIAALHEWHRVLRPGGWLYLVVPDKRFTFDEPRAVTPCAHILRDFAAAATAAEATAHVDEFIYQTDWKRLWPTTTPAEQPLQQAAARQRYCDAIAQGRPVDIHFHTFTPDSLRTLLQVAGFIDGPLARFEVVAQAERYPPERADGIAFLLRKRGRSRTAHRLDTYSLAHTDPAIVPLPLVCPVSLSPLQDEISPDGERTLVARSTGLRYPSPNGHPALLPPASAAPHRPWRRRSWRLARHIAAHLRLAFLRPKP